jgi:release factor glutamine methyltransferase
MPSNSIQAIRENIKKELRRLYPEREIESMTVILFRHRMGLEGYETGLRRDEILPAADIEWFGRAVEQLKEMLPVQYLTGEAEFLGLKLKVGPGALIPRPETEELARWIIDEHAGEAIRILDVGTGSGCIALALASHLPEAMVRGSDAEPRALRIAGENARKLGLNVEFVEHDITRDPLPGKLQALDLLVSNPPYIPETDKPSMEANVLEYEPHAALFVPAEDPLLFYRHLSRAGSENLVPGGRIYLEIHEQYGREVMDLLEASGYGELQLRKDINGKDRMIRGRFNPGTHEN